MTESLGEREMAVGTTQRTIVIETCMTDSLGEREMAVGTQPGKGL